jgi:hypothetical protein
VEWQQFQCCVTGMDELQALDTGDAGGCRCQCSGKANSKGSEQQSETLRYSMLILAHNGKANSQGSEQQSETLRYSMLILAHNGKANSQGSVHVGGVMCDHGHCGCERAKRCNSASTDEHRASAVSPHALTDTTALSYRILPYCIV